MLWALAHLMNCVNHGAGDGRMFASEMKIDPGHGFHEGSLGGGWSALREPSTLFIRTSLDGGDNFFNRPFGGNLASVAQCPCWFSTVAEQTVNDQPLSGVLGVLLEPGACGAETEGISPGVHVGHDPLTTDVWQ